MAAGTIGGPACSLCLRSPTFRLVLIPSSTDISTFQLVLGFCYADSDGRRVSGTCTARSESNWEETPNQQVKKDTFAFEPIRLGHLEPRFWRNMVQVLMIVRLGQYRTTCDKQEHKMRKSWQWGPRRGFTFWTPKARHSQKLRSRQRIGPRAEVEAVGWQKPDTSFVILVVVSRSLQPACLAPDGIFSLHGGATPLSLDFLAPVSTKTRGDFAVREFQGRSSGCSFLGEVRVQIHICLLSWSFQTLAKCPGLDSANVQCLVHDSDSASGLPWQGPGTLRHSIALGTWSAGSCVSSAYG